MIEYIIYGIVDNFIMILGSVSGHSLSIFQKDFRLVLELSMGQELAMH